MVSTLSRSSEPSTARLICSGRLFHAGYSRTVIATTQVEPKLRRDDHLSFVGREGLPNEILVSEWAIHFGGVEERNAAIDGGMEQIGHLLFVFGRTVRKTHAHAAESDG